MKKKNKALQARLQSQAHTPAYGTPERVQHQSSNKKKTSKKSSSKVDFKSVGPSREIMSAFKKKGEKKRPSSRGLARSKKSTPRLA